MINVSCWPSQKPRTAAELKRSKQRRKLEKVLSFKKAIKSRTTGNKISTVQNKLNLFSLIQRVNQMINISNIITHMGASPSICDYVHSSSLLLLLHWASSKNMLDRLPEAESHKSTVSHLHIQPSHVGQSGSRRKRKGRQREPSTAIHKLRFLSLRPCK